MRERVAVVIPTCDRPDDLARALASVRAQSRVPDECWIVDDGATGVAAVPGTRMVRTGGGCGAAAARNLGAQRAEADVLAFLDDDDTWASEYLEEALAVREREGANLVLTAFWKVREQSNAAPASEPKPEKTPPPTLRVEDFLVRNPGLRGSNLVIERAFYLDLGGFDEALPSFHDMDLGLRAAASSRLRYGRNERRRVYFHVHARPRLSSPGSPTNVAGLERFLARYRALMGPERESLFRERAWRLFGVVLP